MLDAICGHIHNYFTDDGDIHTGTWTISGGTIDLSDFMLNGQYFRIVGSALNDGVYQYPVLPAAEGAEPTMRDETFEGQIWAMKVPRAVVTLVDEITEWDAQYGKTAASPYQSESFGGYSYVMRGAGTANGNGGADAWKGIFASRLNQWRKLR